MSYFIIYLAGISEGLSKTLTLIGVLSSIVGVAAIVAMVEEEVWCHAGMQKLKKLLYIGPSLLFIQALIPDKETLAAMVVIPPVVEYVQNSEELHELPDNVVRFINDYLTENSKAKN